MSPSKMDCKTIKLDDMKGSTPVQGTPQISINFKPALGSPNNQNTFQTK